MTPVEFRTKAIQIAGEIVLHEGSELALSAHHESATRIQADSTLLGAAIAKALIEAFEAGADRKTHKAMAHEFYIALERLGASPDLLALVGSYGDTLDHATVLALLKQHNGGRRIIYPSSNDRTWGRHR
jgi:hypothetical protein